MRVSALKAEMATEKAMVSANWRNRMPVVPGNSATGTKTEHENEGGGDYGAGYFLHGYRSGVVRLGDAFGDVALDVFDDHDGVIDDQAGGEGDAEQSQSVDGEAKELDENKCAHKGDRNGDRGNERTAPILKKNVYDEDNQQDGLEEGDQHVSDGFANYRGGVERDRVFEARRKSFGQPQQFLFCEPVDVERIRARELGYADADSLVAVEGEDRAVVFGAQFGAADVFQANQGAVGAGLEDDIFEFGWFGEAADGANADLISLSGG